MQVANPQYFLWPICCNAVRKRVRLMLLALIFVQLLSVVAGNARALDFATGLVTYAGGKAQGEASVAATVVGPNGSLYIVGETYGERTVIGSWDQANIGVCDAFAAKLDNTGSVEWWRSFGGVGACATANAVVVDPSGNIVLGGYFNSASLTNPSLSLEGSRDAFVIQLDAAGNTQWFRGFSGPGAFAQITGIASDSAGQFYLGGTLEGANLVKPALAKIGATDSIAIKLDSVGNTVWAKNFGGSGTTAYANGIAVDGFGNMFLAGSFQGADMQKPALSLLGGFDGFLIKINGSGAAVWAKGFGGPGASVWVRGLAVDANNALYLAGDFANANLISPPLTRIGNGDAFVVRFDSSSNVLWARNLGSTELSSGVVGNGIAVGIDGVYLAGSYYRKIDVPTLAAAGQPDAFIIKLNTAGETRFGKSLGGPGAAVFVRGVAVDADSNVYLAGFFSGASIVVPPLGYVGTYRNGFVFRQSMRETAASNIPSSPIIRELLSGNHQVALNFDVPAAIDGSAVLDYTATCGTSSTTAQVPPVVVSGLVNGVAVACSVVARNASGRSPPATAQMAAPQAIPLAKRRMLDFDGAGFSSLYLRRSAADSGRSRNLLGRFDLNRRYFDFAEPPDIGLDWEWLGGGDLAGRGRSALLSRNRLMTNVRVDQLLPPTSGINLRNSKPDWVVAAIADLDGNGRADVLWRYVKPGTNDSGVIFAWYMDVDATVPNGLLLQEVKRRGGAPLSWQLAGVADLDGDGLGDVIWISPTGEVRALFGQSGRSWINQRIGTVPTGFALLKMGDINADGRDDLIFRDANGNLKAWLMNGSTIIRELDLPRSDPNWRLLAAGDFDGNGALDLVWITPLGGLIVWLMDPANPALPTVVDRAGNVPFDVESLQP